MYVANRRAKPIVRTSGSSSRHAARRGEELEQALLPALRCATHRSAAVRLARALEVGVGVAEQRLELAGDPRPLVDAVRDRGDRNLVDAPLGPEAVPHLARDGAVQLRDAVRVLRRAQRERREAEARVVLLDLAERQEVRPTPARSARRGRRGSPRTSSGSNTSFPAGTGVCVVKTVDARSRSIASSADRPCSSTSSRIRSSWRNAECPSFRWKTVGSRPSPRRTRTPPTPSKTSCRSRFARSPP